MYSYLKRSNTASIKLTIQMGITLFKNETTHARVKMLTEIKFTEVGRNMQFYLQLSNRSLKRKRFISSNRAGHGK